MSALLFSHRHQHPNPPDEFAIPVARLVLVHYALKDESQILRIDGEKFIIGVTEHFAVADVVCPWLHTRGGVGVAMAGERISRFQSRPYRPPFHATSR